MSRRKQRYPYHHADELITSHNEIGNPSQLHLIYCDLKRSNLEDSSMDGSSLNLSNFNYSINNAIKNHINPAFRTKENAKSEFDDVSDSIKCARSLEKFQYLKKNRDYSNGLVSNDGQAFVPHSTKIRNRHGALSFVNSEYDDQKNGISSPNLDVKPEERKRGKITNGLHDLKHSNVFCCPVCEETFKTKRSFNAHILVHCQLVKSPNNKRGLMESAPGTPNKKASLDSEAKNGLSNEGHLTCITSSPLDLSCKGNPRPDRVPFYGSHNQIGSSEDFGLRQTEDIPDLLPFNEHQGPFSPSCSVPVSPEPPSERQFQEYNDEGSLSMVSDRSPFEDETENMVNEAREHEKAFFDIRTNERFLSEDSSDLDPLPLPLIRSGGCTTKIKVGNDDGPPMVYSIKIHSEQLFISRILGTNEETGDKIELYKCLMCHLCFASVSKLQSHLAVHKQKFRCCKCNYSCDSRVEFSKHVQQDHVVIEESIRNSVISRIETHRDNEVLDAENSVTVAALLSALQSNNRGLTPIKTDEYHPSRDEEIERSEESYPPSPSDPQLDQQSNGNEKDFFKLYACRFCGKKFDRAFSCNRHERVHTGYKPCFCRICGRGFSEPRNLRHHVIRFHSDGSLRHLIKRDRRKKKDDENSNSSDSSKDVSKDCVSRSESPNSILGSLLLGSRQESNPLSVHQEENQEDGDSVIRSYTSNLTRLFAASLDTTPRMKKSRSVSPIPESSSTINDQDLVNSGVPNPNEKGRGSPMKMVEEFDGCLDHLEPGEIRLSSKTRIVDDGERGRRLIIDESGSEDGADHSPQFSSYAPRLNIVEKPINRDKALVPIFDDSGRSFYECPYCFKLFGSTSDLNRHLDFHEDLRPYDCKYCDYSARTNSQLKVHKMRHEGIKQFNCDICNYNGVTQSDLNRHKKTQSHVSRSLHVCIYCGLGFYSASQKQVHISNCHPDMEGASSLIQMSLGHPPLSQSEEQGTKDTPSTTSQSSEIPVVQESSGTAGNVQV